METAGNKRERLDALPRGAALGAYTVEDVLGHGGFGIVYRAQHNELGNLVAVKEYLPAELALRKGASVHPRSAACRAGYEDGLRRFRDEARALIEFQAHPSIVSCRDFFRANGTAYLVMEYEQGLPLSELLRRREASGRPFDEADLLAVMVPLLEGLRRVHEAGMLHRDIKPGNILVRRSDERPVLIDFGAAKQGVAEHSKSLAPYTEGYAAWEQVGEGKLGPWTDVYAVGAVMWRVAAGGNPPWEPPHPVKVEKRANAAMRGAADPMPSARELGAGRFSPGVLEAIDRCLKLNEKERVRDCGELLGALRGAESAKPAKQEHGPERRENPAVAVPPAAQAKDERKPQSMLTASGLAWTVALAGLAVAMGAAWLQESVNVDRVAQTRKETQATEERSEETQSESVTENTRESAENGASLSPGERFRDCAECPEMVVIPAGSFLMGSPESEEGRYGDEGPQHRVTIRTPFAAGVYEVTFEEWDACAAAGGCDGYRPKDYGWGRGRRPVIDVIWEDAQAYVRWLSRKTEEEYRLLSEAEWEYAARAGTQTRYSFGDEITPSDANYGEETQPVGSYRANGFGLYDMHGNVYEWVQDCYNDSYRGAPNNGEAWERGECSLRVLRGGSYYGISRDLRSAIRLGYSIRSDLNGFRVARTLAP